MSIDSTNGELSVAQNVDREGANAKTELTLTLTVADKVGLQASQAFTIQVADINDQPPEFSPMEYTAEVTENTASGAYQTCSEFVGHYFIPRTQKNFIRFPDILSRFARLMRICYKVKYV